MPKITNIAALVGIIAFGSLGAISSTGAADANSAIGTVPVARVSAVRARDSNGRVSRFADSRDIEFVVAYDAEQRVRTIQSTRGPNVSDIVLVAYAPNGRLAAVQFRTGYSLFFDYRADGSKVVRDTRGDGVIQAGGLSRPIDSAQAASVSALLVTVSQLESLVEATNPLQRH